MYSVVVNGSESVLVPWGFQHILDDGYNKAKLDGEPVVISVSKLTESGFVDKRHKSCSVAIYGNKYKQVDVIGDCKLAHELFVYLSLEFIDRYIHFVN